MLPSQASPLPVDAVLPELLEALGERGTAVLVAPPGSGKTTRVPLALLDEPWLGGRRIMVLEPRRVAARAAARRLAWTLGEDLGGRVGYRIRGERVVGPATRIEVVTEGVLTRMLQADPSLGEVGAVLFDEFHERSIMADFALALVLDVRAALRPDLRVLVMSATLDAAPVAGLLDGAKVISATVRPHPLTTVWVGRPSGRPEGAVARTVARAFAESHGGLLAFLPGVAEIRTVERMLGEDHRAALEAGGADVVALHGGLSSAAQDEVLRPAAAGRRKVVLATSIAETSVTIDGVRTVVDSGLMRVARFDPSAGMTRLVTLPVSRAAADQRQGRAARQGPGTCYRLWSAAEHAGLGRATPPEILVADLAPLALGLAEWGVDDPQQLRWIDSPPPGPLAAARGVLRDLGAIDSSRRITPHGRAMARLGLPPRLAHLLLWAKEAERSAPGTARLACEIAAVLSEGDPQRGGGDARRDADLTSRIDMVRRGGAPRLAEVARRSLRLLGVAQVAGGAGVTQAAGGVGVGRVAGGAGVARVAGGAGRISSGALVPEDVGRLVAVAYPDRVGYRRGGPSGGGQLGHWLLRNGRGAWAPQTDSLAGEAWVAAAELDGDRREARIWLGAPLHPEDLEELFGSEMTTVERSGWDARIGDVVAARERRLGAVVVSSAPRRLPPGPSATAALIEGVREVGLQILPWTADLERLRARAAFARRVEGERWADLSDEALMADLESWLTPWLDGRTRRADLAALPLGEALWQRVGWPGRPELDSVAPTHLRMPTGERRRLEYPPDAPPNVAVRLQELFGTTTTPTVANGRVPVQLHLTSPAGRPVQVTSDLASFWATTYPQIRGELRARYPRHSWPEDPVAATPTTRATPRKR